jgi:hypothetical protein
MVRPPVFAQKRHRRRAPDGPPAERALQPARCGSRVEPDEVRAAGAKEVSASMARGGSPASADGVLTGELSLPDSFRWFAGCEAPLGRRGAPGAWEADASMERPLPASRPTVRRVSAGSREHLEARAS